MFTMMKSFVVALLAITGAGAFAPQQNAAVRTSSQLASSVESMPGIDVETGKKFVSFAWFMT